jgi:hypothetical protein
MVGSWLGSTCGAIRPTAKTGRGLYRNLQVPRALPGGCNFVENPDLDAREVEPVWIGDTDRDVRIDLADSSSNALKFSLWRIPGRKRLFHHGNQLALFAEQGRNRLRVSLAAPIIDQHPFAFSISAGADLRGSWKTISRITDSLENRPVRHKQAISDRPAARALLHASVLQALDGALAQVSKRDIGVALFGLAEVSRRWHADSELRAQVRYLVRRGRALMDGGYLRLVVAPKPGRKATD